MQRWLFNGNTNFIISSWLTKLEVFLNYSGSNFDQLINGILTNGTFHNISSKLVITKPLAKNIDLSLFGSPRLSINVNEKSPTTTNTFYNVGFKLIWTPYNSMRFITYYKLINGEVIDSPFHVCDVVAKYDLSSKWGFTLNFQNLFNHITYGRSHFDNFYNYSRLIEIPGRTASLSIGYSF
jgi:hypothetical protein